MRKISAPLLNVTDKSDVEEASKQLIKYGVKNLVVKLGNKGSMAISDHGRVFAPAYDVEEVDATREAIPLMQRFFVNT
jgi:sugar/nucleoside kinase (ribokinase family)